MRIREYRGPKNGVLSKESNFSSLYSHFFAREYTRFENTPDLEKGESETQVQCEKLRNFPKKSRLG